MISSLYDTFNVPPGGLKIVFCPNSGKGREIYLGTVMIQYSTEGANLLLVAQGRPLIGERVAYRVKGARLLWLKNGANFHNHYTFLVFTPSSFLYFITLGGWEMANREGFVKGSLVKKKGPSVDETRTRWSKNTLYFLRFNYITGLWIVLQKTITPSSKRPLTNTNNFVIDSAPRVASHKDILFCHWSSR